MKVSTKYHENLRLDSLTALATAGVLGETYIDIDSSQARGPEVKNGDALSTRDTPDIQDVVRASQGTLQNMGCATQTARPYRGICGEWPGLDWQSDL